MHGWTKLTDIRYGSIVVRKGRGGNRVDIDFLGNSAGHFLASVLAGT